jgi:hypothetical protein
MAKIEIPEEFLKKIGPSIAMDVHLVDVKLFDGRVFKKLVVRGGRYITGYQSAPNGESELDFRMEDIKKVRASSILPFF